MKVSDFKNRHKGEMAFLFGGGPSLHFIDMDLIKEHICITINSGIAKHPDSNYFVSDDTAISNWAYYELLEKSNCVKFLYRDKFEKIESLKNSVLFDHTWWFSPKDKTYNMKGLELTKKEPIVGARISMGSAVHIAYILGCNPIVLLGNDCKLKDGKRYFWQFPGEEKQFRVRGVKYPTNTGFDRRAFVEYWNYFAKVNKEKKVDIIDASNSCLNCFPKMSVEEVLNKYGDKK